MGTILKFKEKSNINTDCLTLQIIGVMEDLHKRFQVPNNWYARILYSGQALDPFLSEKNEIEYTIQFLNEIIKNFNTTSHKKKEKYFYLREPKTYGEIITKVDIKNGSYIRIFIKDVKKFLKLAHIDNSKLALTHFNYLMQLSTEEELKYYENIENLIEYVNNSDIDSFTEEVLSKLDFKFKKPVIQTIGE